MATESLYFTLKSLLVLKIYKFLFSNFGQEKGLIRKLILISKFMTSQTGEQIIAIHILPNISRRKGNQTTKFGQLIEYNMRNIFLEKLFTKYGGKTILRPFSKRTKLSIFLDKWSKVLYRLVLLYDKFRAIEE